MSLLNLSFLKQLKVITIYWTVLAHWYLCDLFSYYEILETTVAIFVNSCMFSIQKSCVTHVYVSVRIGFHGHSAEGAGFSYLDSWTIAIKSFGESYCLGLYPFVITFSYSYQKVKSIFWPLGSDGSVHWLDQKSVRSDLAFGNLSLENLKSSDFTL